MIQDTDLLSIQELRDKVESAHQAFLKFRTFSQNQIDAVVEAMGETGRMHARRLAEMAVEETGYGNVPDKTAKNLLNADLLPRTIRGMKTVGVLREIPEKKLVEVGVPMGVIGAILPTTNPTSTAIFKSIIALKAGNAVVHSPHPYARRSTCETIDLLHRAAVTAGAPEGIIGCLTLTSQETTQQLMKHPKVAAILATGGAGLVRAAYSSGKPAFGVGPGNVPVLLDTTANIPEAVELVIEGKSFDYGTVCSSEQMLVCQESLRATVLSELRVHKAFVCDEAQAKALEKALILPNGRINPECVGRSPQAIARRAGFEIPADARILACEVKGVGKEHPLSAEKLSPVLSLLFVPDFTAALDACEKVLQFGGMGHTTVIHSNDEARIREYGMRMPAFRVLVNTASPQGSTGITTNVFPSMTLGCGAIAGNITSDNVGPQHLMNIKRIAYVARKASEAFEADAETVRNAAVSSIADVKTPLASPSNLTAGDGTLERQKVAAAVEQYLATKGISVAAASSSSREEDTGSLAPASAQKMMSVSTVTTESVVDQFLARKGRASVPVPACCCEIADTTKPTATANPDTTSSTASVPPSVPSVEAAVDFVCESDVRDAIAAKRKIRLRPKAIVTPSARDLGEREDVFI
ncbi:MAG: aldehyde dehydrogenase family protein [Bryobacterales bacterium]|nr:aldehyde dehydrogenase family protein [Bryobacterales bacterium]